MNWAKPLGFCPEGGQLGSVDGSQGVRISGPFCTGKAFKTCCKGAGVFERRFASGTGLGEDGCGWRRRNPSYEKKKKVLSFPSYIRGIRTGPPRVPPKSFCRIAGCGCPARLVNQSLASKKLFRR